MATGFEILLETALMLKDYKYGTATGGDTNSLLDTSMVDPPPDDHYLGGTIFVTNGDNGPVSDVIDGWDQSAYDFTLATTQSNNYAANDLYYAFTKRYHTRDKLLSYVNKAIRELPWIDKVDTSITTVTDQAAYDLPTNGIIVQKVEIAQATSSPFYYKPCPFWKLQYDGTNDQLVFDEWAIPKLDSYKVKITYRLYPSEITGDASTVHDWYDQNWIASIAAYRALMPLIDATKGKDSFIVTRYEDAKRKMERLEEEHKKRLSQTPQQTQVNSWLSL